MCIEWEFCPSFMNHISSVRLDYAFRSVCMTKKSTRTERESPVCSLFSVSVQIQRQTALNERLRSLTHKKEIRSRSKSKRGGDNNRGHRKTEEKKGRQRMSRVNRDLFPICSSLCVLDRDKKFGGQEDGCGFGRRGGENRTKGNRHSRALTWDSHRVHSLSFRRPRPSFLLCILCIPCHWTCIE